MDLDSFILLCEPEEISLEVLDPEQLIYEITGKILSIEDDEEESLAGKFRLYFVDIESACDSGFSAFEVLDSYSHTFEFYRPIFGHNDLDFSNNIFDLLNYDILSRNILIIDRLELLPKFRHVNLGLYILRRLLQRYAPGTGLVALKAFPLQFEHEPRDEYEQLWRTEMALESFNRNKKHAVTRLKDYYTKLGFISLPRSPFMFRATSWRLPTVEELGSQ